MRTPPPPELTEVLVHQGGIADQPLLLSDGLHQQGLLGDGVQAALDGLKEIRVFNIKDQFYGRLEKLTANITAKTSCKVTLHDLADEQALYDSIAASDILTNGTSVGMAPNVDACLIKNTDVFRESLIVSDVNL